MSQQSWLDKGTPDELSGILSRMGWLPVLKSESDRIAGLIRGKQVLEKFLLLLCIHGPFRVVSTGQLN